MIEVLTGDTLTLLPSGQEYDDESKLIKISLASIRAPRAGNERVGRADEPWSQECKDRLRVLTVGKTATVKVAYERDIPIGEVGVKLFGICDSCESGVFRTYATVLLLGRLPRSVSLVLCLSESARTFLKCSWLRDLLLPSFTVMMTRRPRGTMSFELPRPLRKLPRRVFTRKEKRSHV